MASWFRRGDLPELPPPELAALGMAPGYIVKYFKTADALNTYARQWGVSDDSPYAKHQLVSAVIPSLKVVCRLEAGLEDKELAKERDIHEYAHTWDWRHHEGGGGWIPPDGWSLEAAKAQVAAAQRAQVAAAEKARNATEPATAAVQIAKNLAPAPAPAPAPPTDDPKPAAAAAGQP